MPTPTDQDLEPITDDEHRAIVLGYELLSLIQAFPDDALSRLILERLDASLTEPHERALFHLPPRKGADILPLDRPGRLSQ